MKNFVRVLGVDDGFFVPRSRGNCLLAGIVFRLDGCVEGILSSQCEIDGFDATQKISRMVSASKYSGQISVILLLGSNFAGFNVVDAKKLFEETGKPIVVVQRRKPDFKKIFFALEKLPRPAERKKLFQGLGELYSFKSIFFQCFGIPAEQARSILKKCLFYSNIPEPLRLAHLVASGTTIGESTRPK